MHEYSTQFSGFDGTPQGETNHAHWCAIPLGDYEGPRSLAMPVKEANLFRRGIVVDGCPAVDEHGKLYEYCADRDLWLDKRLHNTPLGALGCAEGGMGGWRDRMRKRRSKRRASSSSDLQADREAIQEGGDRSAPGRREGDELSRWPESRGRGASSDRRSASIDQGRHGGGRSHHQETGDHWPRSSTPQGSEGCGATGRPGRTRGAFVRVLACSDRRSIPGSHTPISSTSRAARSTRRLC